MRHLIVPLLAAVVSVLSTAPAYADLGDQLFKLLPDDGAANDEFGRSVAISGTIAIVGANLNDDNGDGSGSAYLFDATTGQQLFKLLPDDGAASSLFGFSVAISGNTAIVGAVGDDSNDPNAGSAYLFDISDQEKPSQIAKLLPDDGAAEGNFGFSVAISGATAIVGARTDGDNGLNAGSAYLFDASAGQQLFKLLPDDGAAQEFFGWTVGISGTTAIVGAPGDDENGFQSGSVYLFDTTMGQQLAKLLPEDGAAEDQFGFSVAICGNIAIVGARQDDENGLQSGSVYLFDIGDPKNPVQIAKLLANDGAAYDSFGSRVSIGGAPGKETAIVAAPGDDDNGGNSGSAYLFDISDPAKPIQTAKVLPNDGAAHDRFGVSVAISDTPGKEVAIVGSWEDDDNGKGSGSAYLFDAAAPGKCPWDLDDNGSVGVSDLLSLLASWGPCQGCPADFDDNGSVGVSDLLALLANWGPCP